MINTPPPVRIVSDRISGKSTLLAALAIGYRAQGLRVLVLAPTLPLANQFKRRYRLNDTQALSYHPLKIQREVRAADVVLMDDCDRMQAGEGDPVDVVAKVAALDDRPLVIIGAYFRNNPPTTEATHADNRY